MYALMGCHSNEHRDVSFSQTVATLSTEVDASMGCDSKDHRSIGLSEHIRAGFNG